MVEKSKFVERPIHSFASLTRQITCSACRSSKRMCRALDTLNYFFFSVALRGRPKKYDFRFFGETIECVAFLSKQRNSLADTMRSMHNGYSTKIFPRWLSTLTIFRPALLSSYSYSLEGNSYSLEGKTCTGLLAVP